MPWLAKSVLPAVAAIPSAPPSSTCTWPSSQMARLAVCTDPGTTALALVESSQLAPIRALVVCAHAQRDREGGVRDGRRSAAAGATEPVADAQLIRGLKLTRVVRPANEVRQAAGADHGGAAHVRDARDDEHVVGRRRLVELDIEPQEADRVRAGSVCIRRTDGERRGGRRRGVAGVGARARARGSCSRWCMPRRPGRARPEAEWRPSAAGNPPPG